MSPTIFNASDEKQASRQRELEEELEKMKQASGNERNSLPYREKEDETEQDLESLETSSTSNLEPTSKSESAIKEPSTTPLEEAELSSTDSDTPKITGEKVIQRSPEDYSELMSQERSTTNPLASFLVRPPGAEFVNQHAKEHILLVLRQHPIVNLRWILISLFLLVAPFLVFPLLPLFAFLPSQFKFFAMVGWYLFSSAYVIENFLYWYYNIYIITDERIVDIDFVSLIYRQVSEAKIDKIEDVTATTTGLFAGIFNYGNVTIQTAAEKREFEFQKVPQPAKVTKFLNELMLEEEREKLEGRVM